MGDRYVLKFLIGLSAVGVYGLGHQLAGTMNMLGQSLISAFIPMGLKYPKTEDGGRFVAKTFTYLTFAFVWIALGFSLLSRELIYLLAQRPDYYDAWRVVPLLTLGFVFYTLTAAVEIGFYFAGIARHNTGIIIGTLATNIALNFLLIPYFGIMGSALAAVLAGIGRFAFSYHWAQRLYPLPYEVRRVAMILGIAALYHTALLIAGPLWTTATVKIALTLTFPLTLWSLRFFTPFERERIHTAINTYVFRK
jgi:O-antigen/teichoic acid export membrane protein